MNDEGNGHPASPLAWGHEDGKRFKPFWIEVDSEPVPVIPSYRSTSVQERVKWIVGHGAEAAAEHSAIS